MGSISERPCYQRHLLKLARGRDEPAVEGGHRIVVRLVGALQTLGDLGKMFGEFYDALVQVIAQILDPFIVSVTSSCFQP